jgi:Holliday junction resolvase-like predicted endonuclease
MKLSKQLSGIAGEYYVAAELSRRGYLAAITLRNSEGIDILVSNIDGNKLFSIQVKTTQNKKKMDSY